MKNVVGILVFSVVAVGFNTQTALALAEFKKAFSDKYAAKHKDKEYASRVRKATCNLCHIKGAKKEKGVHNEYGKLLDKLIEGNAKKRKADAKKEGGTDAEKKEKAKLLEELDKAFKKVEKEKSEGGKGPEYGKLIESGKLPVDIAKAAAKYKEEKAKKEKEEAKAK